VPFADFSHPCSCYFKPNSVSTCELLAADGGGVLFSIERSGWLDVDLPLLVAAPLEDASPPPVKGSTLRGSGLESSPHGALKSAEPSGLRTYDGFVCSTELRQQGEGAVGIGLPSL
jgi:hypothetical protein